MKVTYLFYDIFVCSKSLLDLMDFLTPLRRGDVIENYFTDEFDRNFMIKWNLKFLDWLVCFSGENLI